MSSDLEPIRHALSLARERGFAEVVVESNGLKFRADLERTPKKNCVAQPVGNTNDDESAADPELQIVVSPSVGYFRVAEPEIAVGATIEVGQVVGVVASLGDIPYAVESLVRGEVVSFLVDPGQPVMFGQALIQVKP